MTTAQTNHMFAISNDTTKYAVIVDGYIGLTDTVAQANSIVAMISSIDDSPCGAVQVLPPGYRPRMSQRLADNLGESADMTRDLVSAHHTIDIAQYITKRAARAANRPAPAMVPVSHRWSPVDMWADVTFLLA